MNVEQARFNMIEQQIRPWEVLDQGVLSLLAAVHREEFVPPAYRALAFIDTEVPLPEGQCMLAPRVEARLLQELRLALHESVLEVGAGLSEVRGVGGDVPAVGLEPVEDDGGVEAAAVGDNGKRCCHEDSRS